MILNAKLSSVPNSSRNRSCMLIILVFLVSFSLGRWSVDFNIGKARLSSSSYDNNSGETKIKTLSKSEQEQQQQPPTNTPTAPTNPPSTTPQENLVCFPLAPLLTFDPQIKRVIINVGTHRSPLTPTNPTEEVVIGFEALPPLGCEVMNAYKSSVRMIVAAGGSHAGFRLFNEVANSGSASVMVPNQNVEVLKITHRHLVPEIPLELLIRQLPEHLIVSFLKTDAQGYDIEVIRGLKDATVANRICWIMVEAQSGQPGVEVYGNPANHIDFHRELIEKNFGFVLDHIACSSDPENEGKYPFEFPKVPRKDVTDVNCFWDFNAYFRNPRNAKCAGIGPYNG